MGWTELDDGRVELLDKGALTEISPSQLLSHCGYVTESRHTDGLFLSQPIWKNISATSLGSYVSSWFGFLDTHKESQTAAEYVDLLSIAAPNQNARVETLSGGNQQKVVFAKWLNRKARILILDEPTRGVDVGAKLEISNLIKRLARARDFDPSDHLGDRGDDQPGDRVLVLREGSIVGDVSGADINTAMLMSLSLGERAVQ